MNAKIDQEHDFSKSEMLFEYDDTHYYNDILFTTYDFAWTKKPIEDIQQKDSLVINDSNKTLRNLYQLYVGNLTRWTTDQDIADCITSMGVLDLIDVTFFENCASGQSRGFCIITLHSEHSKTRVLNRLPKEKLYGKSPLVTYISNEAYLFFDSKSKNRLPPSPLINQNTPDISDKIMQDSASDAPLLLIQEQSTLNPLKDRQPDDSINPYKQGSPHTRDHKSLKRPNHNKNHYKHGLRKLFHTMPLSKHSSLTFGEGSYSSNLACKQDISMQGHHKSKYAKGFSNKPSSVPCKNYKMEFSPQKIDEMMNRNRIISSSAIARAITNAANGEFSDAIETLTTATSLIKESKVAHYEGSNILVRSLKDVLHVIEIKNCYSKKEKLSRKKKLYR